MKASNHSQRNFNLLILLLIGVCSLLIRLLMEYEFDRSALLYVGIPFLIAMALLFVDRSKTYSNWKQRYVNLVVISLVVMLGSSIVLFEGFVCVVMFMPIYFFIVLLLFLFEALARRRKNKKHRHYIHVLPAFVLLSAFEGAVPEFSFEREYQVVSTRVVNANAEQIKRKLKQPMKLDIERHWLLSIFPMPHDIDAGTLVAGDVHTINFRYHRWFVTNTHEGYMKLEISAVEGDYIRTRFIEDTSYISNYLKLYGTEIYLDPLTPDTTRVTLKIRYHRFLDPVWYFGPLQEFAVGKSAEFLLDEVITPKT